jgi:hypothetical protein
LVVFWLVVDLGDKIDVNGSDGGGGTGDGVLAVAVMVVGEADRCGFFV